MQKEDQVKKIIEYLEGKISNIKERLKAYESPIMQDMAKNSPHLQMDYIRLSSELQANEDNLLAIVKFTTTTEQAKDGTDRTAKKEKS